MDILEYEIDVPEEIYDSMIPKMTIQPLIENALYHGIKNRRGVGKIKVGGGVEENSVYILIEDNGLGMDEERLKEVTDGIIKKDPNENKIYGLFNVNERIVLKFGEEYGISITSKYMEGTRVKISLPKKNQL